MEVAKVDDPLGQAASARERGGTASTVASEKMKKKKKKRFRRYQRTHQRKKQLLDLCKQEGVDLDLFEKKGISVTKHGDLLATVTVPEIFMLRVGSGGASELQKACIRRTVKVKDSLQEAFAAAEEKVQEMKRAPAKYLHEHECVELELVKAGDDGHEMLVGPGEKRGPRVQIGETTFENGNKVVLLVPGQEYHLRVVNTACDTDFVVKGHVMKENGKKVPFLIGEGDACDLRKGINKGYRREHDDDAFKPLFADRKVIFRGYQTRYEKGNYELTQEAYVFKAAELGTDGTKNLDLLVETLYVEVFENVGEWTFNRGGGRKKCNRSSSMKKNGVLVPGKLESNTVDCPGAEKRWESREGAYLGTLELTVKLKQ
ncbi:unnamed protein product [Amoebophrya sp. A120]|nr:unnamed protein product [Amoebophrya sp. A120]|eukprot:GSA120T00014901001.1